MRVVGIDPKLTGTALALVEDGVTRWVTILDVPKVIRRLAERITYQADLAAGLADALMDGVVTEHPKVYTTGTADPQDLIDLAACGAAIAYSIPSKSYMMPLPREWKGTQPKHVHHRRLAHSHPEAVDMVNQFTRGKRHDAWDAVGLAHWGYRRQLK